MTAGTGASVEIDGVSKVYRQKRELIQALARTDLHVPAGSFTVIVGPSGCGKSTLLRMVAGLECPTSGLVRCRRADGTPARNAMVFHSRTLFPWLTLRQNIGYGLRAAHLPRLERDARVDELLTLVGLRRFGDAWPHQISEGMRQRVSLARALAVRPDILLMDEPFGALDEQTRFIMQEELLRIWEATRPTVLFVTHSIDEALLLGDTVVVMSAHPGRVIERIALPFPRPRALEDVRHDPQFAAHFRQIWERIRAEVRASGSFA